MVFDVQYVQSVFLAVDTCNITEVSVASEYRTNLLPGANLDHNLVLCDLLQCMNIYMRIM